MLSAIGLLAIGYWLSAIGYWLFGPQFPTQSSILVFRLPRPNGAKYDSPGQSDSASDAPGSPPSNFPRP